MVSSVYTIFNTLNGKFYVGKANKPRKRWTRHKNLALKGSNDIPKLYNAIRKYGAEAFEFTELQTFASEAESLQAETYYIGFFDSVSMGYNCLEDAVCRTGYVTSEETKEKQGVVRKRFYESNQHPLLGHPVSEVTKQKISETLTGKYFGEQIPNSKLKNTQRVEVIQLYDAGKYDQRGLAKLYGVSQWSIWNILKNRDRFIDK